MCDDDGSEKITGSTDRWDLNIPTGCCENSRQMAEVMVIHTGCF